METDEKATEFITKAKEEHIPNDPACHACFRTPNQTDLPNLKMRRFHPLLQLPLYDHSSCNLSVSLGPRCQRQDLRLQEMRVTKAQNFTSSAELSRMEYDCDLKTYCYQNETKESCHNILFFYRNFLNENKWKKHQEKI